MFYFAYGSNLNLNQMKVRCPNHVFIGPGILKNWKLAFRFVLDIEKYPGGTVYGGVFSLNKGDIANLDRYEGYPNFYNRSKVPITIKNGQIIHCLVYSMVDKSFYQKPPANYFKAVEQGYKHCGLQNHIKNLHEAKKKGEMLCPQLLKKN